jgi:hypothetical protein
MQTWHWVRMTPAEMRKNADDCDRLADRLTLENAQSVFVVAAQWREMADQIERLARDWARIRGMS